MIKLTEAEAEQLVETELVAAYERYTKGDKLSCYGYLCRISLLVQLIPVEPYANERILLIFGKTGGEMRTELRGILQGEVRV